MSNINDLLNENLNDVLKQHNFYKLRKVQEETLQDSLNGTDIIVRSSTGSGKTLSYLLPILNAIDDSIKTPQAIVLAPSYELASQVYNVAYALCKDLNIEVALLIGSANIDRQLSKLKNKPKLIIGTSGRILKLVSLKKLKMHTIKTIVLDEGDRLLSEKHLNNTEEVIKKTLKDRQLVLYSATIDDLTVDVAKTIMKSPLLYNIKEDSIVPKNIVHHTFITTKRDKIPTLRKIISAYKMNKVLLFTSKQTDTNTLVDKLNFHNKDAIALNGEINSIERKDALDGFRSGKYKVLVCSDIFSRGLDIEKLFYVINFDLTEDFSIYQHRVGRIGRTSKIGTAISLVEPTEVGILSFIGKNLNIKFDKKGLQDGSVIDQ